VMKMTRAIYLMVRKRMRFDASHFEGVVCGIVVRSTLYSCIGWES
jgi:hypothetical protein